MMNTQTNQSNRARQFALLAALSLFGTTLALPAFAHGQKYGVNRSYNDDNSNYSGRNNYYSGRNNYYAPKQNNRYTRLNRINRYGVRGRIVAWGEGPLRGCFRVKRTGKYRGDAAIVTVRYCKDNYGQTYVSRGSKQLVKYLNYYRPARSYNNHYSKRGY